MTQEEYQDLKETYIDMVKSIITDNGGFHPQITVIGKHKPDSLTSLVQIVIPEQYLKSDEDKQIFIDDILPNIAKELKKKFTIDAVAWASEAWMRIIEKDKELKNWKDAPIKKEILIITIDSKNGTDFSIMEILRKGKQVNNDGNLIDQVELIDLPEFTEEGTIGGGKFTNLYRKFTQ